MATCRLPGEDVPLYKSHPWLFGLLLAAGALLFILATASLLSRSLLFDYDQAGLAYFTGLAERSPSWLPNAINFFSNATSILPTIIAFGMGAYYLHKKCDRRLYLLLLGFFCGLLWFWILAFAFNRERPALPGWLSDVPFPSYPSGHVINWTTLTVILLYLYLPNVRSHTKRGLIVFAAVAYLLFQGFTRLYLEAHYPTDVLAGFGVGITWISLVIAGIERYDWDRREREEQRRTSSRQRRAGSTGD